MLIGSAGFLCYFLYDCNSILWKNRVMQKLFFAGTCLVVFSTLHALWSAGNLFSHPNVRIAAAVAGAVLFFSLLIYTLFFALPFTATYVTASHGRSAYTGGVYGLCRHPGVLWFAGFYVSLAVLAGQGAFWLFAALMTGWDILYVIFQDCWSFPRTFDNYQEYKENTPFLLPSRRSIRHCIRTWKQ